MKCFSGCDVSFTGSVINHEQRILNLINPNVCRSGHTLFNKSFLCIIRQSYINEDSNQLIGHTCYYIEAHQFGKQLASIIKVTMLGDCNLQEESRTELKAFLLSPKLHHPFNTYLSLLLGRHHENIEIYSRLGALYKMLKCKHVYSVLLNLKTK